jgi:hypothetical protein
MESLFGSDATRRRRSIPPDMRRLIVDVKAEYPGLNPNEISRVCYVRFGRRPVRKTVNASRRRSPYRCASCAASRLTTSSRSAGTRAAGAVIPAQRFATSRVCAAAPTGPFSGSWMVVRTRPTPLASTAAEDSRPTHSPRLPGRGPGVPRAGRRAASRGPTDSPSTLSRGSGPRPPPRRTNRFRRSSDLPPWVTLSWLRWGPRCAAGPTGRRDRAITAARTRPRARGARRFPLPAR